MAERGRGPLRGMASGFLLAACSGLGALALAELLVRVVSPQQLIAGRPDVYAPRDSLGWVFRPNLQTVINTGERPVTLRTDSAGLRTGAAGRRDDRPRVLLIGDSFLAALQVEEEQSIAGLVAEALRAARGRPVSIRNAGVPGWDPPQYLVRARQLLAAERSDLMVVFVYLGNDIVAERRRYIPALEPTPVRHFRLPTRFAASDVIDAWFRPANDWLERHSHLFVLMKERFRPLLMRAGLTAEYFPIEFMRSEASSSRWGTTADLLAELQAAAALQGVPTLLVLLPTPWQMEPAVFHEYSRGFGIDTNAVDLDQPNRLLGEQLRARGLPFLDLLEPLRARAAEGAELFGRVDRHLSPDGHRVVTDLVVPAIDSVLGAAPVKAP